MKFIRDIIGEKRQADGSFSGMPQATATATEAQVPDVSSDASAAVSRPRIDTEYDASGSGTEVEPPALPQDATDPDLGMSEEVAKFFATTDESNLFLDEYDDSFGEYEDAEEDVFGPEVSTTAADVHSGQTATPDHIADADPTPSIQDDKAADASSTQVTSGQIDKLMRDLDQSGLTGANDVTQTETPSLAEPIASAGQFDEDPVPMGASDAAPRPSAQMPGHPTPPAVPSEPTMQDVRNPQPAAEPRAAVEVPQPAVGRGASRHGRVKTRLLGFNTGMDTEADPMSDNDKAGVAPFTSFPVGWLIVVDGPGRGSAFTLFQGVSTIGRGEDQTVRLDFGDNSISRAGHASIAYDARQKGFFIGHGGKANIVRRNDRPVLSTEELAAGDTITIGETSLRFVPLCCQEFSWDQETGAGRAYANQG
ncbi:MULTISPECIES: FHA domain-containing protein [unclassified Roseovarius]|uniref:FHA domain-containing protein n=1 Tax=unclassified Roseovarius TaxID=2614913 RepID=UPI00273D6A66|nr:FHA domain-containing protein [Roseovarius sp. MMSF_3350]